VTSRRSQAPVLPCLIIVGGLDTTPPTRPPVQPAPPWRDAATENRRAASARPAFPGCILSVRELDTLRQLARDLTCAEAAQEAGCSESTIRSHLHTAYRRLGVSKLWQALAICREAGWLDIVSEEGAVVELADRRVTWAQRLYLEAFDQSLRAGDDPAEVRRTETLREAALLGVCREAGTAQPWRQPAAHPLERIAQTLGRLRASDLAA
jgi:DNA-binding CsgD family transcriptional regulator